MGNFRFPVSQPSLTGDEQRYVLRCLTNNQLTYGPMVAAFEEKFAEYFDISHALVCSNGTAALHLALVALGIKVGDEVIVPDLTFIATANAVTYTGATPVLVDISPDNLGLDPDGVRQAITDKTRAIIVVHLYGEPADLEQLLQISRNNNIPLIEDAAEGLGGLFSGEALGTHGLMGTFSFYGNKIITTGEGGAVVTNDSDIAARLRMLRGQGQSLEQRYLHPILGFNYRMTDVQAALGLAQLETLDEKLSQRFEVCDTYRKTLGLLCPWANEVEAAPWLFTIELPTLISPGQMALRLEQSGIETRPVFIPMHQQPMYRANADRFPVSANFRKCGLSLPTYPELGVKNATEIASLVLSIIEEELEEKERHYDGVL